MDDASRYAAMRGDPLVTAGRETVIGGRDRPRRQARPHGLDQRFQLLGRVRVLVEQVSEPNLPGTDQPTRDLLTTWPGGQRCQFPPSLVQTPLRGLLTGAVTPAEQPRDPSLCSSPRIGRRRRDNCLRGE